MLFVAAEAACIFRVDLLAQHGQTVWGGKDNTHAYSASVLLEPMRKSHENRNDGQARALFQFLAAGRSKIDEQSLGQADQKLT